MCFEYTSNYVFRMQEKKSNRKTCGSNSDPTEPNQAVSQQEKLSEICQNDTAREFIEMTLSSISLLVKLSEPLEKLM